MDNSRVRQKIESAIETGAPLYNSGDAKGCWEVYKAVIEDILANEQPSEEVKNRLEEALRDFEVTPL